MIDHVLLAASGIRQLWYAIPLVLVISLVYAATRHESVVPIFRHALGCGTWIVGLMAVVLAILLLLSWWV